MCSRGSVNIAEDGVLDSDLIVLHVRAGSVLFSRSARSTPTTFHSDFPGDRGVGGGF